MKSRTGRILFAVALLGCGIPLGVLADSAEEAALRDRIDKLENELAQLKEQLGAPKKKPVTSALDVTLYGYVKVDAAYDDSRVSVGNFSRWVESESVLKDDSHFNLTANQTRLGADIIGPKLNGVLASGKIELDLYGAGAGENKPEPMIRHAYLKAEWPESRFAILAGQTFDIISPLFPNTVNYTVGWWQGNVGYRRPQIRLIKDIALDDDVTLKLEGGISRSLSGHKSFFKDANDTDTGADAGFPTVVGHTSITFPLINKLPATVGFSGHFGGEEIHSADLLTSTDFDTWSINTELRLPVTKWLLLQAEAFYGANFDSHLGGIGQGINTNTMSIIRTRGGWAQATITPNDKWQFNLGGGIDDPLDRELSANMRACNYFLFGNVFYWLNPNLQLALELSYLRTSYINLAAGDAWREQFAIIYKF
jgi:hypothetical protein